MITKLHKIENGGIFENYIPKDLPDFKRYNLFYGWNASGKSTLAKIFWHLETKQKLEYLDNIKYQFDLNGTKVNESSTDLPFKLFIFNAQFIKENTDFVKSSAASIAYIGKEKVELKQEVETLSAKITEKRTLLLQKETDTKHLSKQIDEHFIACGKALRDLHSTTIYSRDDITKTTALKIWESVIKNGSSYDDFILDNQLASDHFNVIKQTDERKPLTLMEIRVDSHQFNTLYKQYQELLFANPVSSTIERLRRNPEIQDWVYQGLRLHEQNHSLKCEYCDQEIPAERQQKLSAHFNDEFKKLQTDIDSFISNLETLKIVVPTYNPQHLFQRYITRFTQYYHEVTNDAAKINAGLDEWINYLQQKKQNPLSIDFTAKSISGGHVIRTSQQMLNGIINHHNNAVKDFMGEAQKSRTALDNHVVAQKSKDFELLKKYQAEEIAKRDLSSRKEEIERNGKELLAMQTELADDTLVLTNLNTDLHKFMGRNEISLEKNTTGGYMIIRNGKPATNLSEGEKTAISLVYFMHKLGEKENKLADSIIVLDDPVSSFDSNHLFTAGSFVMTRCRDVKQLFVLTHNFWFFKLVRDWMQKRLNKKKERTDPNKIEFYSISRGVIRSAEKALVNHHSEYHFIFTQVKRWADSEEVSWTENFSIANHCRRLLESFNAFKTPTDEGFGAIMDKAQNKVGADTINKLQFFLNKYSHLDRIEVHENAIENIQGEGRQVAKDTLKIIEELDSDHFVSMVKLCTEKEVQNA